MSKEDWSPSRRAEHDYARSLWEYFVSSLKKARREGIGAKVISSAEFARQYAVQAAEQMITALRVRNAKGWREAAEQGTKSSMLHRALMEEMRGPVGARVRELIKESAHLISTFPASVATLVAARATAQQQAGGRSAELASGDARLLTVARARAKLIARTQVSKASSALTEARSEELAIPAYVWETSQDERVRPSHRLMQGVICFWNDPPAPEMLAGIRSKLGHYSAGNCPNDRCYPAPLVNPAKQVNWPHKVYSNNVIRSMTLSQFLRLSQRRVAA